MEKKLNGFLADLVVETHKVQALHWYVKGPDFFEAHEQLDQIYAEVGAMVDEFAEVMLQNGMKPDVTLERFLASSSIAEVPAEFVTSTSAYAEIAKDYEYLLKCAEKIHGKADEKGCRALVSTIEDFIDAFSKRLWMLKQR